MDYRDVTGVVYEIKSLLPTRARGLFSQERVINDSQNHLLQVFRTASKIQEC